MIISSLQNEEIIKHSIPTTKGNLVGYKTHVRDYSSKISEIYDEIVGSLTNPEATKTFLDKLKKAKGKYIRDQLSLLKTVIEKYGSIKTSEAIKYCSDNNIISIPDLKTILERQTENQSKENSNSQKIEFNSEYINIYADKRDLGVYTEVFNE